MLGKERRRSRQQLLQMDTSGEDSEDAPLCPAAVSSGDYFSLEKTKSSTLAPR